MESGRARAGRRTWLAALVACLAGLLIAGGAAPAWAQVPGPGPQPGDDTAGGGDDDGGPAIPGLGDDGDGDAAPDEGLGAVMPRMNGRPIERIQFRGNRKVEDDAIRVNLLTRVGATFDPNKVREDIRAMWKMGFFADVRVEAEIAPGGGAILTFVVTEKPSIRKILVAGNDGLELDKINEVIDLQRDAILDVAKIKKNRQKIQDLYVDKGYYLAKVDYDVRPVNEAEVDVYFIVDERAKVQIRDVQFIGNEAISDDELRGLIATQKGGALSFLNDSGTFNEEAFERDLLIISAHYWDKGFATVNVGEPQLRLSRDKRYMYLSIPIEEGPVYKIASIEFRGDLIGTAEDQAKKVKIKPGSTFSRSVIAEDRERLSNFYMDQGYAYANVLPLTKPIPGKNEIALIFEVERGKKAYFERINIRGNSKTRDKVIRREMKISEGELFNNTNLEISKRRINALGFFEKVDVSTKRGSSDEFVEVNVEVSERATGTFQIGAGFSSVENFIAQAQISQNNLFGRGQQLTLQAQLSSLRQLFLLRFVEPYFLDTNWTFAFDLYNQSRAFGTFARNASGGDLTWGYPLSYEARAFLTYKLEDVGITTGSRGFADFGAVREPIEATDVANLFRGGVTSSLRASLSWDSRNNRLFPSGGWYDSLFVEWADRYTASENVFLRWGGFLRHYRELWGPMVLHLNAEVGVTTSRDPLGVPISERYLIGGIYDVRGFAPRSLGPVLRTGRDPDDPQSGLTLGGNMQVIFNSEIEFPLFKRVGISGVVFYDMGNAYNLEARYCSGLASVRPAESLKFDPCFRFPDSLVYGIRKSAGFGFRWFSPIGPLRFEWGIPLDRQANEDPLVFEFTIGNFL
ncbi:MAG: outer membrane protein assembly factor BamA [Kofleriaceae bacterium]|nr:outer membrane protein assembly factor BamA [Kofleriaceae bacterium]MCB9573210.1 outer membrane protein assembly factor BamA [Kofleriaceae bacterium]